MKFIHYYAGLRQNTNVTPMWFYKPTLKNIPTYSSPPFIGKEYSKPNESYISYWALLFVRIYYYCEETVYDHPKMLNHIIMLYIYHA